MSKKDGGPAFPVAIEDYNDGVAYHETMAPGLTKREWFAGMALAGILAAPVFPNSGSNNIFVTTYAYKIADSMIAEGEKE